MRWPWFLLLDILVILASSCSKFSEETTASYALAKTVEQSPENQKLRNKNNKEEAKKIEDKKQEEKKQEDKKQEDKKSEEKKQEEQKQEEEKESAAQKKGPPLPPGIGTLMLSISGTPAQPYDARFKNDWYVRAYNIDDYGRPLGPAYFGWSDFGGKVDIHMPIEMFSMPMVVKACNEAAPLTSGTVGDLAFSTKEAFIPPFCNQHRITVDPITTALWRDMYALGTQYGAQSWSPSNVDCALWAKSGIFFYLLGRVQAALYRVPQLDNILIPIIPAIRDNPFIFFKTRVPQCIAEVRHNGSGLNEGPVINPKDLETARGKNTPTVGRNGLIRTLCADAEHQNIFKSSLIINNNKLDLPDNIYDLESNDFVGNVASWQNPAYLSDFSIREYTVRHTNGYPRNHDMFEQVCSATALTIIENNRDEKRVLKVGSGLKLENLFGDAGPDTLVWLTSSGDNTITDEDTWAIFFNSKNYSFPKDLLGKCNPSLFCRYGIPNFSTALIDEVIIVELLGFRTGDFRDVLMLDYDHRKEDLFIGQRAEYVLEPTGLGGDQTNFMTTVTYLNKYNKNTTLSLCDEASDDLSRQHINQIEILSPKLSIVGAAEMIAKSKCFSNSAANQRFQNYNTGLTSMNNHKGVLTNLFIPFAWASPTVRYDIFLKKFNESVFRGPITTVMPHFTGLSLEIPTLSEGDELLFASEAACCGDFKVTIPCTPTPSGLPLPGMPVAIDTLGVNRYVLAPPTGSVKDLIKPKPKEKPAENKPVKKPSSSEKISSIANKNREKSYDNKRLRSDE